MAENEAKKGVGSRTSFDFTLKRKTFKNRDSDSSNLHSTITENMVQSKFSSDSKLSKSQN